MMEKKSWWKRVFGRQAHKEEIDIVKDLKAIMEFLDEINDDVNILLPQLKKLENLEKERQVARSGIKHINLETQGKVLDKLLEFYESFQNDVDINGIRLKAISGQFLRNARKIGMTDLVQEKKKDKRWKFFW